MAAAKRFESVVDAERVLTVKGVDDRKRIKCDAVFLQLFNGGLNAVMSRFSRIGFTESVMQQGIPINGNTN